MNAIYFGSTIRHMSGGSIFFLCLATPVFKRKDIEKWYFRFREVLDIVENLQYHIVLIMSPIWIVLNAALNLSDYYSFDAVCYLIPLKLLVFFSFLI